MVGCYCQNAWDDDIVTDTIWHPGTSGKDAFTTIYLSKKIIISKMTVEQYKVRLVLLGLDTGYCYNLGPQWDTGYASKMSVTINGDTVEMRPQRRSDFSVMGIIIIIIIIIWTVDICQNILLFCP